MQLGSSISSFRDLYKKRWNHWIASTLVLVPEFRLLFPQLTGVLTLAFFIHNCVITIMKSNKNQQNNVSLVQSDTVSGLAQFVWFYWMWQNSFQRTCTCLPADWWMRYFWILFYFLQVRDLSVAYLLVGLTYLYVGVLIFAAFPSPPLSKDCIEPVRLSIDSPLFAQLLYFFFFFF